MRYTKAQVESLIRNKKSQHAYLIGTLSMLAGVILGMAVVVVLVGTHAVNIDFSKAELTPFTSVPQILAPNDVAVETATGTN